MKMNPLNKEYTLDNFIFGDCNKLALDTAKLVVENTEKCYNPLLIYGKMELEKLILCMLLVTKC